MKYCINSTTAPIKSEKKDRLLANGCSTADFYSRFRGEIPKILRVLYYSVLIIHPAGAIACLLVHITMGSLNIGRIIVIGIAAFDSIWKLAIDLLFWQNSPGWAYERWITKKRGQRKRRKQLERLPVCILPVRERV